MGDDPKDKVWGFIRLLLASVADMVILPMQDILSLGSEARMNTPATVGGNWTWRMTPDQMKPKLASRLHELNRIYGRLEGK